MQTQISIHLIHLLRIVPGLFSQNHELLQGGGGKNQDRM